MAFGCGPGRVSGTHGIQELHEPLGGAHREVVDRMTDGVCVDVRAPRPQKPSAAKSSWSTNASTTRTGLFPPT